VPRVHEFTQLFFREVLFNHLVVRGVFLLLKRQALDLILRFCQSTLKHLNLLHSPGCLTGKLCLREFI
jgi:hypothetical protein